MSDTAYEVYQGRGWMTQRRSVACALDTLDAIETLTGFAPDDPPDALSARLDEIHDLALRLEDEFQALTRELMAIIAETLGDNQPLLDISAGIARILEIGGHVRPGDPVDFHTRLNAVGQLVPELKTLIRAIDL